MCFTRRWRRGVQGAWKRKGPARGDERGPGPLTEAGSHSEGGPEEGVDRNLVTRLWRGGRARTNAKREGWVCARRNSRKRPERVGFERELKEKGARSEDRAHRKWGKWTREEETPFAYGPNRGRRIRLKSVSGLCGTEGGGFGRASQRQSEYVLLKQLQQCGWVHVSHALRARLGQCR